MFHLEQEKDAELLTEINKGTESVTNIDYKKVYDIVTKGNSTGSFRPDMSVKSQIKFSLSTAWEYNERIMNKSIATM